MWPRAAPEEAEQCSPRCVIRKLGKECNLGLLRGRGQHTTFLVRALYIATTLAVFLVYCTQNSHGSHDNHDHGSRHSRAPEHSPVEISHTRPSSHRVSISLGSEWAGRDLRDEATIYTTTTT